MPSADDFDSRLNLIADLVDRIGDELESEIHGQTGEGEPVKGLHCKHGDHRYEVLCSTGWEHILIRFRFDVDGLWHVRNNLSPSSDRKRVELSRNEIENARGDLESELQNYPNVEKREMRLNLKQILCREGCSVEFDTITEGYNIHGFTVNRKIFLEDGELSINMFEKSVQNVINFGWTGRDIIIEYYGLVPGSSAGSPGY